MATTQLRFTMVEDDDPPEAVSDKLAIVRVGSHSGEGNGIPDLIDGAVLGRGDRSRRRAIPDFDGDSIGSGGPSLSVTVSVTT